MNDYITNYQFCIDFAPAFEWIDEKCIFSDMYFCSKKSTASELSHSTLVEKGVGITNNILNADYYQ